MWHYVHKIDARKQDRTNSIIFVFENNVQQICLSFQVTNTLCYQITNNIPGFNIHIHLKDRYTYAS